MQHSRESFQKVYKSLMSCIVGTVSTLDLHSIRSYNEENGNDMSDYYEAALRDHCAMNMYQNSYVQ